MDAKKYINGCKLIESFNISLARYKYGDDLMGVFQDFAKLAHEKGCLINFLSGYFMFSIGGQPNKGTRELFLMKKEDYEAFKKYDTVLVDNVSPHFFMEKGQFGLTAHSMNSLPVWKACTLHAPTFKVGWAPDKYVTIEEYNLMHDTFHGKSPGITID